MFRQSFTIFVLALNLLATTALAGRRKTHEITVAVMSINDFHSGFVRDDFKQVPGAPALLQTVDSLCKVYPYHLVLASGDNFGGSYFNAATGGVLMPMLFDRLGITVSALGNHEFDEGQQRLGRKWDDSPCRPEKFRLDYVCANVRTDDGLCPDFVRPYAIRHIPIGPKQSLKVALVGLITSSTAIQASKSKLRGVQFDGRYSDVLDSLSRLSDYAAEVPTADLQILLTHIGTSMDGDKAVWDDADEAHIRNLDDPMWDGIFTAHLHEAVEGRVGKLEYPVVQGSWHGQCVSLIKYRINLKTRKIVGVETELCPVRPSDQLTPRAAALKATIDSVLVCTKTPGGTSIGERLTHTDKTLIHSRQNNTRQTLMGSLVCQSYAECVRRAYGLGDSAIVVGVSHFGSIRAGFTAGDISVMDVGESLPFANSIECFRLNGRQLRNLLAFGLHNVRFGRIQTSWLDLETDSEGRITTITYVGPDGQRHPIADDTPLILAADEYMTTGGDGYSTSLFPRDCVDKTHADQLPTTTDAFINYLRGRKID